MDSDSSSGSYGMPRYAQGTSGYTYTFYSTNVKQLSEYSDDELIAELQRRIKK